MAHMSPGANPPVTESDHMDEVDTRPWEATEADEMEVLRDLYRYNEETGAFEFQVGD